MLVSPDSYSRVYIKLVYMNLQINRNIPRPVWAGPVTPARADISYTPTRLQYMARGYQGYRAWGWKHSVPRSLRRRQVLVG